MASTKRTTIGLFGGSFNPPHLAHQMVCLYVLEACSVDAVWMIPTYRHPFAKHLIAFEHRHAMCERAAAIFSGRVVVSRIEEELAQPVSRTLDTIEALRDRHPEVDLRLVIGGDILAETDKWYRWDEIVRLAPPIVVDRAGYTPAADPGRHAASESAVPPGTVARVALPRISSTEIRVRLARGESAVPLVPSAVMDYIAGRGLYR